MKKNKNGSASAAKLDVLIKKECIHACVALFFRLFKFTSVYIARLTACLTLNLERGIHARVGLFFACLRLNIVFIARLA